MILLNIGLLCLLTIPRMVTSRMLMLSESTGVPLRANSLYVRSWERSTSYTIICSTPSNMSGTVPSTALSWTPTPTSLQGTSNSSATSAMLTVKNLDTIAFMEFNCTSDSSAKNFEPTTFRLYRKDDKIEINDTMFETFVNVSGTTASTMTLTCKDPSNPYFSLFRWFLDEVKLNGGNGTLTIYNPNYLDVGVYMCKLSTNTTRLAFYNVTGAAFLAQKHSVNWASFDSTEGATVKITFKIYGNPLNATGNSWTRKVDGEKSEDINADFFAKYSKYMKRMFLNPTLDSVNGEFELQNVDKTDRAEFTFNVANVYGSSSFTTLVRVKGKLDALWPFLGILIELAILFAIIFVYERRRAKQDIEDGEYNQNKKSLSTPVMTENEDNLRLRKL